MQLELDFRRNSRLSILRDEDDRRCCVFLPADRVVTGCAARSQNIKQPTEPAYLVIAYDHASWTSSEWTIQYSPISAWAIKAAKTAALIGVFFLRNP